MPHRFARAIARSSSALAPSGIALAGCGRPVADAVAPVPPRAALTARAFCGSGQAYPERQVERGKLQVNF